MIGYYQKLWSDDVERNVRANARNLDEQVVSPGKPVMCKRCVVTNKRPRITFNADGVCSACQWAEEKNRIDWIGRRRELTALLDENRDGYPYNVIVPASGGKDSSHVALCMRENFMIPLLTRWAPLIPTQLGERNWQALLHRGFDGITAQPNGLTQRKLARLGMEFYGDPFLPFIYGQLAFPMKAALERKVKLVFYGENGEAEYGGDTAANHKRCWSQDDWDRVYLKGASVDRLFTLGYELGCMTLDEIRNCSPYYNLPFRSSKDVQFHWLSYYERWRPQRNYYNAVEKAGFMPKMSRSVGTYSCYASLDDGLDDLHYYFAFLKFGIGRCTSDACHEIRDGELDREDALSLVQRFDGELTAECKERSRLYLGIDDPDYLEDVFARFRREFKE